MFIMAPSDDTVLRALTDAILAVVIKLILLPVEETLAADTLGDAV